MSELLALGISHKTAPVALRERLAFTKSPREGIDAPGATPQGRTRGPSRRACSEYP